MQVTVNTHQETVGGEDVTDRIEGMVEEALARFAPQITTVQVHIGDVNAAKGGARDKRCMIEARPTGHTPVAVTHQAESVKQALNGALQKAARALDTALAKRTDHKGADSVRNTEPG